MTLICDVQNAIFVLLSEDCLEDDLRARFELAHEAIHCLSPSWDRCRRIEEGVTVGFSLSAPGLTNEYAQQQEALLADFYREALSDVRKLEAIEPNAIRLLRQSQSKFREFTPDLLQTVSQNSCQEPNRSVAHISQDKLPSVTPSFCVANCAFVSIGGLSIMPNRGAYFLQIRSISELCTAPAIVDVRAYGALRGQCQI